MSHYHRNLRAFEGAQRAWENLSPGDDGWTPCDTCDGARVIRVTNEEGTYDKDCPDCDGEGGFDADGNPCRDPETEDL